MMTALDHCALPLHIPSHPPYHTLLVVFGVLGPPLVDSAGSYVNFGWVYPVLLSPSCLLFS